MKNWNCATSVGFVVKPAPCQHEPAKLIARVPKTVGIAGFKIHRHRRGEAVDVDHFRRKRREVRRGHDQRRCIRDQSSCSSQRRKFYFDKYIEETSRGKIV